MPIQNNSSDMISEKAKGAASEENGGEKKPGGFFASLFRGERGETVRAAASFVLIFLSVFTASPRRGIVSSLPIILPAALIVCLFYDEPLKNTLFAAVSALIISLADYYDVGYSAVYTVCVAAFFAIAFFSVRLFRKWIGEKKIGSLVLSALIVAALIAVYALCFGTPWGSTAAERSVREYAEKKYPNEDFVSFRPCYYVRSGGYTVEVYYNYNNTVTVSPIKLTKDGFEDGYFENLVYLLMTERRTQLISLLKANFINDDIFMTCAGFEKSSESYDVFLEAASSEPKTYLDQMSFNVTLGHSVESKEEFAAECEKYAAFLKENGTVFSVINFYGGYQGKFLYQLAYRCGSDASGLEESVADYSSYHEFVVDPY